MSTHPALLESPDGESRARMARTGDSFPLDPTESIVDASTETPGNPATRPWGLRFAVRPPLRPEVACSGDRYVYDPAIQQGVNAATGELSRGKRSSGTKETTGDPDSSRPASEETTSD